MSSRLLASPEMDEWDLDLCCSEDSADFSPDVVRRGALSGLEDSHLMEYRVFSATEAKRELQFQLESERRVNSADHISEGTREHRLTLVDTVLKAAEKMRISFPTKALAIRLLDKFMAAIPGENLELFAVAAMACLSIAGKADEINMPNQMLMTQLEACWELDTRLGDLRKVELMVLTALDWRTHDLTAASVLDTLVCLLGYQQNSVFQTGCYEQMHVVRESCRLLLAKALRDPRFIHFRPSSLATAAVLLLLDTINDLRTDLASFRLALLELYSPLHSQEVVQCKHLLGSAFSVELIPSLWHCRVEVSSGDNVVRVYQQKEAVTTTPTSVLHSAQALAFQTPGRATECRLIPPQASQRFRRIV